MGRLSSYASRVDHVEPLANRLEAYFQCQIAANPEAAALSNRVRLRLRDKSLVFALVAGKNIAKTFVNWPQAGRSVRGVYWYRSRTRHSLAALQVGPLLTASNSEHCAQIFPRVTRLQLNTGVVKVTQVHSAIGSHFHQCSIARVGGLAWYPLLCIQACPYPFSLPPKAVLFQRNKSAIVMTLHC